MVGENWKIKICEEIKWSPGYSFALDETLFYIILEFSCSVVNPFGSIVLLSTWNCEMYAI